MKKPRTADHSRMESGVGKIDPAPQIDFEGLAQVDFSDFKRALDEIVTEVGQRNEKEAKERIKAFNSVVDSCMSNIIDKFGSVDREVSVKDVLKTLKKMRQKKA